MKCYKGKFFLLLIFLLVGQFLVVAQKTANNWYFGNSVGINFNETPPAPINSSVMSAIEGCSSISDANGQVLFYTNGITIYNRNNKAMLNGGGIRGDLSSTSNSLIIKLPGSDSLYYLFTVGAADVVIQQFNYCIINMKGDNGLGAVTKKNIFIDVPIFEKLAAVRHCNKKDAWIIVKRWGTDEYDSYLFTAAGLAATPVKSTTGFIPQGDENYSIGALKFSTDSKKLAAVYAGGINKVELLSFNNVTGQISNSLVFSPNLTIPTPISRGMYGVEFSPNGNLLYISANNNSVENAVLYQLDVSVADINLILASKVTLMSRPEWYAGALQLGPDKKIYFTLWKDSALSVIENPDVPGLSCNFLYNQIILSGNGKGAQPLQSGLPSFIASDLNAAYASYEFSPSRIGDCFSHDIKFTINYTADTDSVRWNFGDGLESVQLEPTHTFLSEGSYTVSLVIYKTDCSGKQTFSLQQAVEIIGVKKLLPPDVSLCEGKAITIKSLFEADSYLWNTGEYTDSIRVYSPEVYWLEATTSGCKTRDSLTVSLRPTTRIHLGHDTTTCLEKPVTLQYPAIGNSLAWNTGETTASISVTRPGKFWLVSLDNNIDCLISDTLTVFPGNCELYFPSAFSPNGDGINESFGLVSHIFARRYELVIYNRWGQPVFRADDQDRKWDGTFKGKAQPSGVYGWILKYTGTTGRVQNIQGTVLIIR